MRYLCAGLLLAACGSDSSGLDASIADAEFESAQDDATSWVMHDGGTVEAGWCEYYGKCEYTTCPPTAPVEGDGPCTPNTHCEYGAAPSTGCNTQTVCNSMGRWSIIAPPTTGCENPIECPTTFNPTGGVACTKPLTCAYGEGVCGCIKADSGLTWKCEGAPGGNCPVTRPRIGTACSVTAQCDYGHFCTELSGTHVVCCCGTWRQMWEPTCIPK